MNIILLNELNPCIADYHKFIEASGSPVTICDNPSLPGIISKTWKWPPISVAFFICGQCCAIYSAVIIRKTLVSLPHFDNGALWVNSGILNNIRQFKDETGNFVEENAYKFFYFRLLEVFNQIQFSFEKSVVARVNLDQNDFLNTDTFISRKSEIQLQCRGVYPVLSFHDSRKVTSSLKLKNSYDEQFYTFNGNLRRKIRKSQKNGIIMQVGGKELIDQFYQVYRSNIYLLGSFGLPKRFFVNLLEEYQFGEAFVILASLRGEIVGAAIFLSYLNHAENSWFATLRQANKYYVSYALHNTMIELAISNGCTTYSFGRSTRDSTVHQYKKQWGAQDQILFFNSTFPQVNNIRKFDFARKLIKLIPYRIARRFDDFISHRIY